MVWRAAKDTSAVPDAEATNGRAGGVYTSGNKAVRGLERRYIMHCQSVHCLYSRSSTVCGFFAYYRGVPVSG